MSQLVMGMDLGTSGFRAKAVDLSSKKIIATVITMGHPLPGANVMDHLHFALEVGEDAVAAMMVRAVNLVIRAFPIAVGDVVRFAVCGNPIQLSLFQGIEVRDLAFAGAGKLASLGVVPPKRDAAVLTARDFPGLNLPGNCQVLIPPSVRHEVGADALAMIMKSQMLEETTISMATDFGTNSEMALFHDGTVTTGSAAAGPAIEGQQLTCGMTAAPGAVCDLEPSPPYHRLILLDSGMEPVNGALVDLGGGEMIDTAPMPLPTGITGTGTIALTYEALNAGLIQRPRINTVDGRLHLGERIHFTKEDLHEAGKAFGAIRAAHITLCHQAGVRLKDIAAMYVSGASGTYMNVLKAMKIGLIPPRVRTIRQLGNTSLAMACDLAVDPDHLAAMAELAQKIDHSHCMLASSEIFKRIYILEYAHWTEGMPMSLYRDLLQRYDYPDLPRGGDNGVEVIRTANRDICNDLDDLGSFGLKIIGNVGRVTPLSINGCTSCMSCIDACPPRALGSIKKSDPLTIILNESLCNGVACRRCETICPVHVFKLNHFFEADQSRN